MRLRYHSLLALLVFCALGYFIQINNLRVAVAQRVSPLELPREDAVRIAEAYSVWKSLGDGIWPGWTKAPMPFLFITDDVEFAIGFPKALTGFQPQPQNPLLNQTIQTRKRVFDKNLSASFPIEGVNAIVFGTPAAVEKSSTEWVLTVTHEMFHVLQYSRGASEKIKTLSLGPESDPSWQLNFPFPYKDPDVMRLIHLQSYLIYLAVNGGDESEMKYNASTGVEAVRVYQALLRKQSPDDKFYKYSQFQEWTEGIAFYTEYKMAEAAANGSYKPTESFRQLADFKTYQQVWEDTYKGRIFLAKHAGRAAKSRTTFYHLGLGKGLLLDRIMPDWKTRYFTPSVWINDLLMIALGQPIEIPSLSTGMIAPDFSLLDASGKAVSLNQYRGKVVLIDFWQTWCPPCLEELPYLNSLQEKYGSRGLVILGITDRLDKDAIEKWRGILRETKLSYTTLLDEKGTIAGQYNISAYPHKFLLDKTGRLLYDKLGYVRGDEVELEKQIVTALNGGK